MLPDGFFVRFFPAWHETTQTLPVTISGWSERGGGKKDLVSGRLVPSRKKIFRLGTRLGDRYSTGAGAPYSTVPAHKGMQLLYYVQLYMHYTTLDVLRHSARDLGKSMYM